MELKPSKIPVILIEPGIIATPLLGKSIANAEECVRNLPLTAHEIYSKSIDCARKTADKFVGSALPVEKVAEVVARGGFGTSVTPVSQFYFQQAYANVTQGPWKKITGRCKRSQECNGELRKTG